MLMLLLLSLLLLLLLLLLLPVVWDSIGLFLDESSNLVWEDSGQEDGRATISHMVGLKVHSVNDCLFIAATTSKYGRFCLIPLISEYADYRVAAVNQNTMLCSYKPFN